MLKGKYNIKIHLQKDENKTEILEIHDDYQSDDFCVVIEKKEVDLGQALTVKLIAKKEIILLSSQLNIEYKYDDNSKIFCNGYESWTDSREFSKNEAIRGISSIVPRSVIDSNGLEMYGDYTFKKYTRKKGELHGFTYSYVRNYDQLFFIGSLSERAGYTIINHDTNNNMMSIEKDCYGIKLQGEYNIFDISFLKGNENEVFDEYFKLMNIDKPNVKKMNGYTSWYNHYQNISEEIILDNVESIIKSNINLDIFQIDDGYQEAVGDWLNVDKSKFPKGMKYCCDYIKENHMTPGLWLAPFACEFKSEIAKNHPDWLLKKEDGTFYSGGCNWGGFYILDICNEDVKGYLKNVFDTVINKWGFELVKLDFLYATAIIPRNNKTRGQIMCEAMDFLRECVGDKLILGCGVPLGPAFGKVDFCRIGCDVGLDYDDKLYMRFLHRERVSTRNALINTIGRRHLNGRAFLNDPDVFLLRDNNIKLNDEQKKTLALVNHIFGSLLFTSDNVKNYDDNKKELFDYVISKSNIKIISVEQDEKLSTNIKYIENGESKEIIVNLKNGKHSIVK